MTHDDDRIDSPDHCPVTVILERRPAKSAWIDFTWRACGITLGEGTDVEADSPIRETDDCALFAVSGHSVTLYADECESYYFNLVSDRPLAYVVAHAGVGDAPPRPFRISMSFDEAHAYLEGEDEIYAVDIPPELYLLVESFVITHYFPQEKRKRKLRDWAAESQPMRPGAA